MNEPVFKKSADMLHGARMGEKVREPPRRFREIVRRQLHQRTKSALVKDHHLLPLARQDRIKELAREESASIRHDYERDPEFAALSLMDGCPASAPVRHMWTASWQALFSR
jgi:hypothetical protein